MAPVAGHDKFRERFARARLGFAVVIGLRKRGRIARISDGNGCDGVPAGGNTEDLAGLVWVEAGHLVDEQSAGGSLDAEECGGGTGVILRVAIGCARFGEGQFRDSYCHNRGCLAQLALNSTNTLVTLANSSAFSFVATM